MPEGVELEHLGGTVVVMGADGGAAVLNATAGAMLAELLRCGSADEAVDRLLARFDVSREDLERDVREVSCRLCSYGLLAQP